jgi:hypothetical protein
MAWGALSESGTRLFLDTWQQLIKPIAVLVKAAGALV